MKKRERKENSLTIWISSRGNGTTTTFLPSLLPSLSFFRVSMARFIRYYPPPWKSTEWIRFLSNESPSGEGEGRGGIEPQGSKGWVFDRRINIRSIASLPSLIVALSCKEIVIYRKKWWFEHSLILSANTYIYTLYKRELRFQKELLLLLWSDDGKWIPSLLPSHCLLIENEAKCNEVDWSNQRNCLVRFTINILIESSTFRLIAPRSDIIAK